MTSNLWEGRKKPHVKILAIVACENSKFSGPNDMVTNHIYIGVTKFVINPSKYIEDELKYLEVHKNPLTPLVSWKALIRRWTNLGIAPFSLSGAWLAGHSARLRIKPITAFTRGQRDGGCMRRTIVGRPPCRRTAFWDTSHSGWREVRWRRAQTAGSVISSRSPAAIMVRTSASIPPTWHTITWNKKIIMSVFKETNK